MSTATQSTTPVDNRAAVPLPGKPLGRVAILTADRVEDVEFFYPYYRFVEAGYSVDVLTPKGDRLEAYRGTSLTQTMAIADAAPDDYDILYIPGGLAPTELRQLPEAVAFVQRVAENGRLVGAVCHGPQMLVAAGLVMGRHATSWHEVGPEITAAGGQYDDEPVVVDGQFVTSRKPGDLPSQMARIFEMLGRSTRA
jgi:protease I